jgi:hypothetical protein
MCGDVPFNVENVASTLTRNFWLKEREVIATLVSLLFSDFAQMNI